MSQAEMSKAMPLEGADLVLLMLAAPGRTGEGGRVNGITRLEKLIYIADRESDVARAVAEPIRFAPYHFGPYSKQIYEAVELLEQVELLEERQVRVGEVLDSLEDAELGAQDEAEYVERQFMLTDDGRAVAELLASRNRDIAVVLAQVKGKFGDMSLNELLRYVYRKYPESAEKSKIRDRYL